MKQSVLKSLFISAAVLIFSSLTLDTASAQGRGGRPSGGSFHGSSRGSFNAGARGGFSRQSGISRSFPGGGNRAFYGRPNYAYGNRSVYRRGFYGRPGYGFGYRRPYYSGYYNYYRPYLGFSLSILPFGYYPFYYGDAQFYYSGGLFYRQYDNEYKVVVPPVGAEVPSIPSNAKQITVNGQTYYEYKGVYYNSIVNAEGKTVYVIAGKDGVLNTPNGDIDTADIKIGDIVDVLPEGTKEVTLKGEKFYVSEDGIYYEEVLGGDKVTYRVVGL